MIQRVLSHYSFPLLSSFGLLLFMGVFVGALFWVFRTGSSKFYSDLSDLPFKLEKDEES
jgi:cbb3-type cytochrome oxidase subunit 3